MIKKDAYLIIAHKQWNLLRELIHSLDYEQNDIYIHIDKKSQVDLCEFKDCTQKSQIKFFQKYDVQWGTESQVDVEIFLFQKAYFSGMGYRYYHLLSGQDLPIKPVDEIHQYFDNKNIEYLEFGADNHELYRFRLGNYHYRGDNKLFQRLYNFLSILNGMLGRDRLTRYNLHVYKGSNWASLSNEAVKYLVEHRKLIYRITRHSHCADEVYKQTILMNADQQFNFNSEKDIRYIDWEHHEGPSPHTLRIEDYENLMHSECLFARKFDLDIDNKIVERIIAINR